MISLNQYQADNLLWLLDQCRGTAADTGDWLGELILALEAVGAKIANANTPELDLYIDEYSDYNDS